MWTQTKGRVSPPRLAPPDPIEALADPGEAGLDQGFEFQVGEDVRPVALDAFADEFADIGRVDAVGDALAYQVDEFRRRPGGRHGPGGALEAPGQIAGRIHDPGTDEARTQHRDADPARREFGPQALGKRHDAVLGHVVGAATPGNQPRDRGGGDDLATLAVRLDQRPEDLDSPDHRHQIDPDRPGPGRVGPRAIRAAAAHAGVVDQHMNLAIA